MKRYFGYRAAAAFGSIAALAIELVATTPAWAQQGPQPAASPDWVMSYALVILSIGLGLFVVCRMGRRSTDIRRPMK